MKEFGFQESWIKLFRIDFCNLQMYNLPIDYDMDLNAKIYECGTPLLSLYLSKKYEWTYIDIGKL